MEKNLFDQIRQINKHGAEFWSARDLYKLLGYTEYGKFLPAIERAKEACKNSGQKIGDHFAGVSEMVLIGSDAERSLSDMHLSRYACYLIAQNGDPRKEAIALAQTYFAIQTRKQEINDLLSEDRNRVYLRGEIADKNKKLSKAAKSAGVINYATFQDYGYMGLYGGLRQKDIHVRKGLKKNEKILDHMGSEELSANWFRTTQAEAKLRREGIMGESQATQAHFEVGKKVRKTIHELGGTMPENLPKADAIKFSKKRIKSRISSASQRKAFDAYANKEISLGRLAELINKSYEETRDLVFKKNIQ